LVAFALSHEEHKEANTPADNAVASPIRVNARMVAQAAKAGVAVAQRIVASAAEALGVGLVNVIHIYNPEVIILGGGVTKMGAMLLEPAQRIVEERAMRVPRDAARIVMAQLGADVGIVGAGALIYYNQPVDAQ
nr:ROK family protein [Ktedonobacteraceae bacterium]